MLQDRLRKNRKLLSRNTAINTSLWLALCDILQKTQDTCSCFYCYWKSQVKWQSLGFQNHGGKITDSASLGLCTYIYIYITHTCILSTVKLSFHHPVMWTLKYILVNYAFVKIHIDCKSTACKKFCPAF